MSPDTVVALMALMAALSAGGAQQGAGPKQNEVNSGSADTSLYCGGGGKRTFNTFASAAGGRDDWLCDASVKMAVLRAILPQGAGLRILVPGVANSTLGIDLQSAGYDVTVADLDPSQVSDENKAAFDDVVYFDLLGELPEGLKGQFDCVVDSSVTDVFMQVTSAAKPSIQMAKKVHSTLLKALKPDGKMVVFSMNNEPWNRIYQDNKQARRKHARVRPIVSCVSSRGRNTCSTANDVLVLVASASDLGELEELKVDGLPVKNITEWSDETPDDWISDRN